MRDLRSWVRAELAERLAPRRPGGPAATVLGAGSDDLDAGRRYLEALAGTGLAVSAWPRAYGGLDASPAQVAIVRRELAAFDVPDLYPYLVGLELVGPTLVAHGTPEQCARWLPPIATGAEIWCQLFSEPDAGSDLAGLTTAARRDGDTWRVTGEKVWTSRGRYARWGLLLARHDPTVPKHQGISAFGLEMHAPGVEVRPLRQMNGDAHFAEVFLDDVPVPDADRIAAPGDGWRVALTCLGFERGAVAGGGGPGLLDPDRLIGLARDRDRLDDRLVRDALARVVTEARVTGWTGRRRVHGSAMKLRGTRLFRLYVDTAARILGPDVMRDPAGPWPTLLLTAPSLSIRGGTDEIQRNIVGERVLGLPPEPRVDRDVPFDRLPRSGRDAAVSDRAPRTRP